MKKVFGRPQSMKKNIFHYCAGCGHSIAHRLIAEVIDELDIRGITIGVPPAGCAVLAYNYFDIDMIEAQHGRGPATATGIKRVLPDRVVFSYQGDGDLAAIGIAESFHAANRGENITVVFINNAVYGMTGGQMAPTSILGQKTTTSPTGRESVLDGYPDPGLRDLLAASRNGLHRTVYGQLPGQHSQDPESDPQGLPVSDRRPRLFPRRDPLPLSDELEDDADRILPLDRRGDEQSVPPRRHQGPPGGGTENRRRGMKSHDG